MDLGCLQPFLANARYDGVEQLRGLSCPACQGRPIDIESLCRHHLGLPVKREVMIELGYHQMGERAEAGLS